MAGGAITTSVHMKYFPLIKEKEAIDTRLTSFGIEISLIQSSDKRRFGIDGYRIQLEVSSDKELTSHFVRAMAMVMSKINEHHSSVLSYLFVLIYFFS